VNLIMVRFGESFHVRCGRQNSVSVASPSGVVLPQTAVRMPFATSLVSSTLYYWWLDFQGGAC
jgi:hypothetical protein